MGTSSTTSTNTIDPQGSSLTSVVLTRAALLASSQSASSASSASEGTTPTSTSFWSRITKIDEDFQDIILRMATGYYETGRLLTDAKRRYVKTIDNSIRSTEIRMFGGGV